MWQQISDILVEGFNQYGLESIGYWILGLCFGMFFIRSTQKRRFHLISLACYILAFGTILLVVLPALVVLNPNFLISMRGYDIIQGITISLGCSFLGVSLLVSALGMSGLLSCVFLFFVIQVIFIHVFRILFPEYNLIYWSLAACWVVVGFSFHMLRKVGKTSLFDRVGDSFFALSLYYIARELNFVSGTGWLPVFIFGGVSVSVLMAQIKFMESTCEEFEENLQKEKQRRTQFWDIAPFPILVSKLLDDSVLYINPVARNVLKITPPDVASFRLTDYFADSSKRNELVEKMRENRILDSFEVEMRSPRSGEKLWLDLSARVVELDGELALYINLHNVTEQKETEEKLFKQASTDTLTGLYNRRQFEAMVAQAMASAQRYQTPYCVMMSDIDHFKSVNDTYGHEAGDVVLKEVAHLMQTTFRTSDIIGRFGGEEFIVFFTNTDINGAKIAAEHFRQAVEQAHIEAEGKHIPVTISLGLTDTQNNDLMRLTKEADLALYYSKEHGRNQVSVYTPELENQTESKQ